MAEEQNDIPSISMANTKREMLEAYHRLKEKLEQQAQRELKPEKEQKARKEKAVVESAEESAKSDVNARIMGLKEEIGNFLSDMAGRIESENKRYQDIKAAIEARNEELKEIYEIEKSAHSLAALLEAQNQKKEEFEAEMARRKRELETEIEETRKQWEKEKQEHDRRVKEEKAEEEKRRKREREEFEYEFSREKAQKQQELNDELEKLQKSMADQQEAFEKEIAARGAEIQKRESAVAEREKYMDELQKKVDRFPEELKKEVNRAVAETTERLQNEAKKNEELLAKGYEGEKNVLKTKIESLEKLVADQQRQIETLSRQMDTAYGKVQEIAVKAVSGKGQEGYHTAVRQYAEETKKHPDQG